MTRKLQTPEARSRMPERDVLVLSVEALKVGDVLVPQTWDRGVKSGYYGSTPADLTQSMVVVDLAPVRGSGKLEGYHVGLDPVHPAFPQRVTEEPFYEDELWLPAGSMVRVRPKEKA